MEDIIDIIVTETTNTIEITAQPNDEIIDVNIIDNREDIVLNVTPTVVEININSLTSNFGVEWGDITGTLSDQEDLQDALDLKADLVDGKVPSSQLPSYVDDVVEVATFSALPATGEIGKIYVILDTNKIYRWSGSVYVEIADSTAVWGAITGTLSSQTDLQSALDAKLSVTTAASTYVPYTGATGAVDLGTNDFTSRYLVAAGALALGGVVSMRQDATYLAKGNGYSSIASSGVMFDFFGYTGASTYKNFSLRFDGLTDNTLRIYTLPNASGTLALTSDLAAYVPYTGATGNVNLGNNDVTAGSFTGGTGTFTTSGAGNSVAISHSSGSGIALNITKSGNGEGIYVNKSSGSGNAVTIVGTLNATTLVKNGGTSSQFLKADGSVDSSVYALDSAVVHLTGVETITGLKYFFAGSKHDLLFVSETVGYASQAGYSHFKANTNHIEFINSTNTKSTKFIHGNAAYEFTMPNSSGTIALTSNLASYLPLAGGTLTGALSGTSATFTGDLTNNGELRVTNNTGLTFLQLANTSTGGRNFTLISSGASNPHSIAAGNFYLRNSSTSTTPLIIDGGTGAATFSSSVTAGTIKSTLDQSTNNQFINISGTQSGNVQEYSLGIATSTKNFRIFDLTNSTTRLIITDAGNVGIGTTAPAIKLHVSSSSADVLRLQGTNGGGSNNTQLRFYGSASATDLWAIGSEVATGSSDRAFDFYDLVANQNRMRITSGGQVLFNQWWGLSGGNLNISSNTSGSSDIIFGTGPGNGTERLKIRADGVLFASSIYNTSISGTTRSVSVRDDGALGYVSSTRESKINISTLENVEWLNELNSVLFNYRKKDEEGNYTNDYYNSLNYGLIAEEVEKINKELVFYDIKEDGKLKLAGVHYDKLIIPLLKKVQEQDLRIKQLENK
jgi:hypothetical protein